MSVPLLLLRHGLTQWNAEGRIQGHSDLPLSAGGGALLRGRALPARYAGWTWHSSPLRRALHTAALLGAPAPLREPRLMEMHWGRFEGRRRAWLREQYGAWLARHEALGRDFRPPGGESPGELQARLGAWLDAVAAAGLPVVAVTHKGVLKAALGLAFDWDLTGKAPVRLERAAAHRFRVDAAGRLVLERANVALVARGAAR